MKGEKRKYRHVGEVSHDVAVTRVLSLAIIMMDSRRLVFRDINEILMAEEHKNVITEIQYRYIGPSGHWRS